MLRVEHDTDLSADGLRGKIFSELCADSSSVAVRSNDLAPNDPESGVALGVLGLEDVGDSLAVVVLGVILVLHVLEFEQSLVLVLGGLSSLVADEGALHVESKCVSPFLLTSRAVASCRLSWCPFCCR